MLTLYLIVTAAALLLALALVLEDRRAEEAWQAERARAWAEAQRAAILARMPDYSARTREMSRAFAGLAPVVQEATERIRALGLELKKAMEDAPA